MWFVGIILILQDHKVCAVWLKRRWDAIRGIQFYYYNFKRIFISHYQLTCDVCWYYLIFFVIITDKKTNQKPRNTSQTTKYSGSDLGQRETAEIRWRGITTDRLWREARREGQLDVIALVAARMGPGVQYDPPLQLRPIQTSNPHHPLYATRKPLVIRYV